MSKKEPRGRTPESDLDSVFTRNPLLTIVPCGDDEVVVKHGSRSRFTKNIRDQGRTGLLGRILRHVTPPVSLADLHRRGVIAEGEVADARRLVAYLRRQGVLVDPAEDVRRVYLETIAGGRTALAEVAVGVIGAGYFGSRIAAQLGQVGVGRLMVADGRRVEREAVDRLFFDLAPGAVVAGRPYVECFRAQLAAAGRNGLAVVPAPVDDEAAVRELMGRCDFTVVALERFSPRTLHLANSVALELGKPWMSAYIDGSEALIGPLYVPGETCCYNEFEIQHEATLGPMKDEYLLFKEAMDGAGADGAGYALPPYLSVASGLAVAGALRFLLGGRSHLVGRANRLDFERLSVDFEEVLRLPRCPACAGVRPGYRHLFM